MDASLHNRLLHVEEEFILAVNEGKTALLAFDNMWSGISVDLDQAVRTKAVSGNTSALGNSVALRIATLSEYLLDFQNSADAMSSSLQDDLESIFARVEINDTPTDTHQLNPTPFSTSLLTPARQDPSSQPDSTLPRAGYPAYIAPAYSWLLQNLHNPYPSKEVRNVISSQTGSPRTAIDTWFIDVRKRIGWNALRRKQFSNKRIEIVESASQFFLHPNPDRPLDSDVAIAFATIETCAKDLYAERFAESALAAKLDVAVKDMTPEMKDQAKADERRRKQQARQDRDQAWRDAQAASSYPSPRRSPSSPPEPLLSSDELDLSVIRPMSLTSRKRSRSPLDASERNYEQSHDQPNKRSRLELQLEPDVSTSLPSPAPSLNEHLPPTDPGSFSTSYVDSAAPVSRKRRLSDADSQGAPKRPRNILSGPRLHSVSDPLPSSSALSAWFENHFGIPSTVTADDPNVSLPFDVELYDYSTIASGLKPLLGTVDASNLVHPQQDKGPMLTSLPASEVPSFALNVSTNNFDYNELFYDLEDTTSEPSTQNTLNQSDGSTSEPPSFEFNIPRTSFEKLNTIPDTIVIADFLVPAAQDPESSFDWMFPPLLLSEGTYDIVADPGSPQDAIFGFPPQEMNFHPTDLPCNNIAVTHMSAGAEKAAKQRKLMEMKEATRRLEAEIAAS